LFDAGSVGAFGPRRCGYIQHVEAYLILALGKVRLAELSSRQLTAVFAEIAVGRTPGGKPRSGATVHRIRVTLRAALNAAGHEHLDRRQHRLGPCLVFLKRRQRLRSVPMAQS